MRQILSAVVKHMPASWNGFMLFHIVLSIVLLTLNPFDFQAFTASEFWVWRFSIADFSRNILLFFPFGLMLRHRYGRSHTAALIIGLGLSSGIEVSQLFIEERTSNVVDLISNSGGALLGSLIYQGIFFQRGTGSNTLPFTFMLMPLCWVIGIVSSFQAEFVWGIVPCLVAALALFQFSTLHSSRKRIAVSIWTIAAILPLMSIHPIIGGIMIASVPVILRGLAGVERSQLPIGIVALLCISSLSLLQQTYGWYVSAENWVWISLEHLSWMMGSMSVVATGSSFIWYRLEKS